MISFPFIFLQISTLIFWWLLWLLYFPIFLIKNHARALPNKMIFLKGLILMCFLGSFLGWALTAYRYYWPRGIITSAESYLYLGPEKEFPKRGLLAKGERIVIEQKKDGWYYVSSAQGKGWVQTVNVAVEGDA